MGWEARFHKPIELAKGKPLRTLSDARDYVLKLPKTEQRKEHWETAAHALMVAAADANSPTMMAEIGVRSALAGGSTIERPEPKPGVKATHWGRARLKRDG